MPIACDEINSALRKQFYPDDAVAFAGIKTWRGITRHKFFLGGRSYTRTGSILTRKMVIYPIIDKVDDDGNQSINRMAEIKQDSFTKNDWNQPGDLVDFFAIYRSWRFDWLDVAELIRTAGGRLLARRCRRRVTAAPHAHRTNPRPPPHEPESRGLGGLWIRGRNCKVRSATRGDIALMSHSLSIAADGSAGSYGRKT
jgi:hypothetical protein